MATTFIKDPDAVLDYFWDWKAATNNDSDDGDWLESGETITDHTVTVSSGLTKDSDQRINTNTTVEAWFSGGTAGETYTAVCHITTSAGREDDRTMIIICQER